MRILTLAITISGLFLVGCVDMFNQSRPIGIGTDPKEPTVINDVNTPAIEDDSASEKKAAVITPKTDKGKPDSATKTTPTTPQKSADSSQKKSATPPKPVDPELIDTPDHNENDEAGLLTPKTDDTPQANTKKGTQKAEDIVVPETDQGKKTDIVTPKPDKTVSENSAHSTPKKADPKAEKNPHADNTATDSTPSNIKLRKLVTKNEFRMVDQTGKAVLAIVNGKPIYMQKLWDTLTLDFGLSIAQQIIADEVVRQALKKHGLSERVTPVEIDAETKITIMQNVNAPGITHKNAMTVLPQLLREKGITMRQWRNAMARNIRLDRLSRKTIKISEKTLKQAYFFNYGGRHSISCIKVSDYLTADEAYRALKKGAKFADVVKKYSKGPNAKTGGHYAQVGLDANPNNIPIPLWKQAIRLKKVGQYSFPIKVEADYYIIRLDKIIPPKHEVSFKEAREDLERMVKENRIRSSRARNLRDLMLKSKIKWVDPLMSGQNEEAKQKAEREARENQ